VRRQSGESLLPNTSDWYGRFRLGANSTNDYLIDRDRQRRREDYNPSLAG
jgi:phthalate 4,5-dioxygenase